MDNFTKRASALDILAKKIYDFVSKDETHLEVLKMSDLVNFFSSCQEDYPQITQSLVFYEKKSNGLLRVVQIMMDEADHEIRTNSQICVGREWTVQRLDEKVIEWFGNESKKILKVEVSFN